MDCRTKCVLASFATLLFLLTLKANAVLLLLDDTVEHLQHFVLLRTEPVHLFLSPPLLLLFPHYRVIEGRI